MTRKTVTTMTMPAELTPKRATLYLEPDIYEEVRARASRSHRPVSELVNGLLRQALTQSGTEIAAVIPGKKSGSASFDRLQRALKRRRLGRARRQPRHA